MKNIILIVVALLVSIGGAMYINQKLTARYFIEEYYSVQNLDPKNEKNAEVIRQKIQQLIQKTIPSRYRPTPDKFQCFKIISESVFFCSADTHRKSVAEHVKKLLQETVPQQLGWVSQEEMMERVDGFQGDIKNNQQMIADLTKQLDKVKKVNAKQAAQEKKFSKTNDLYKKSIDLMQKKIELLQKLITEPIAPETRSKYKLMLEEAQMSLDLAQQDHNEFKSQNKSFSGVSEQRDTLTKQISELKQLNADNQKNIELIQKALDNPNSIGKVADVNEFQLVPDLARQKFAPQQKQSNVIWFTLVLFFLLTNFVLRLKPLTLVPFQDDATMTEGIIK